MIKQEALDKISKQLSWTNLWLFLIAMLLLSSAIYSLAEQIGYLPFPSSGYPRSVLETVNGDELVLGIQDLKNQEPNN